MTTNRSVRSLRKEFALTQDELADLLGTSQSIVSRIEADDEPAAIKIVLGLQLLFDSEPQLLFWRRYIEVEDALMRRAAALDHKLRGRMDEGSLKKQVLLEAIVERVRPVDDV